MIKKTESFIDKMSRLFPNKQDMKRNSGGCRQLTLQITEDCNLNCSYCYQHNKTSNKMSLETAKSIIDCLFEDNNKINTYYNKDNLNSIILEFIGGEPFLEIELIDSIMEYFLLTAYKNKSILAYRYMISLCSNGILYNTKKVKEFLEKWRNHISLTISLDGCKELHDKCRVDFNGNGSYDKAVEASINELKYNPDLPTKMTLAPENIEYFNKAIQNLITLGYKNIFCNYIFEKGWTVDHAKIVYKEGKNLCDYLLNNDIDINFSFLDENIGQPLSANDNRNWCGGTGLMLAVDYKGDFYPCLRYMKSSLGDLRDPFSIGSLKNGIGHMPKDIENISLLDSITRKSQSTDECFYCDIARGCSWCSAYNYQEYGTPNKRATFICIMHKARVLLNCYYWNRYYRKNNIRKTYKLNLLDKECLTIIDKEELRLLRSLEKDVY